MIERSQFQIIKETLKEYPVLALTGPRQSGKTTMLKSMFEGYTYVNLENPDNRNFAENDTKKFLDQYNNKVIFDEAQNVTELFSYLQGIVDEKQVMGQFILSGSQNFQLTEKITQSLAGRVAIFKLLPFDFGEMKKANWLSAKLSEVMTRGFYPAIFERQVDHDRYYANYLKTYVSRDISQLINVKDSRAFQNFLKLCAAQAGQLLNISELARDAGVSHTTARNWLSILETSYVLYQLPPYYKNFGKRIMKSPKLYFYDVGLLCHLLSIRKENLSSLHPYWGHIFENMIVTEMLKQNEHLGLLREFYFWRDSKGHEIDLLYEKDNALHIYEIKASSTIQPRMFKGLQYFTEISKEKTEKQFLIYAGEERQERTQATVLNWAGI